MSLSKVLAFIEAGESKQALSLVITEVELAQRFGCTLTEGKQYQLANNGRRIPGVQAIPGYTLLDSKYILLDDKGGLFAVFLLECQATQMLGIVLASSAVEDNPFSQLLAAGKRCRVD